MKLRTKKFLAALALGGAIVLMSTKSATETTIEIIGNLVRSGN